MICKHCGHTVRGSAMVCDHCGQPLTPEEKKPGAAGIRQGRSEAASSRNQDAAHAALQTFPEESMMQDRSRRYHEDAGRPSSRRGILREDHTARHAPVRREKKARVHKVMINWALLWLIVLILLFFSLIGGFVYLKTTDNGQLILARMGRDVNYEALWSLGTEYLDQGYIEKSITAYEAAWKQNPQQDDLYNKLLLLAEAYEAGDHADKAEEVYTFLYTEVDEENAEAYRNRIRLLWAQSRMPELADFLKVAYEKTGDTSFIKQREEIMPSSPTASLPGSTYRLTIQDNTDHKDIELFSEEEYDIYYMINGSEEDTLPEAGTLYTGPISLYEGSHVLRAVAISSDLVSDEFSATYHVALPIPEAPKSSLAPDDYVTKQRVWLRYNGEDADEVTIYYTIDGQSPTANSPIYTGEPIPLPGGRVHIKAVAVNKYGKVSNEMDVNVKIDIGFKRYFNEKDHFSKFTLMSTSMEKFADMYGQPKEKLEITDVMPGTCYQYTYDWGTARFGKTEDKYVLYDILTSSPSMTGPRGTKVGMEEKTVTDKYRDMGQTFDQNGDRSIYFDEKEGWGKSFKTGDHTNRIDYLRHTQDGGQVVLSYYLTDGLVTQIGMRYEP